MVDDL
jgi:hypothetical protein